MRIIGLDIHRAFAEAVAWRQAKATGVSTCAIPFRARLSQSTTVRRPARPAGGQISGMILVRPKGPTPPGVKKYLVDVGIKVAGNELFRSLRGV